MYRNHAFQKGLPARSECSRVLRNCCATPRWRRRRRSRSLSGSPSGRQRKWPRPARSGVARRSHCATANSAHRNREARQSRHIAAEDRPVRQQARPSSALQVQSQPSDASFRDTALAISDRAPRISAVFDVKAKASLIGKNGSASPVRFLGACTRTSPRAGQRLARWTPTGGCPGRDRISRRGAR